MSKISVVMILEMKKKINILNITIYSSSQQVDNKKSPYRYSV